MDKFFTKEGFEKMKKELRELKTVKTREIAELIRHTASFGDLSENAAYEDAKEKQMFLMKRIAELERLIKEAQVVEKSQSETIQVGSTVELSVDGKEEKVKIVGPGQANFEEDKISYESPLGRELLGRKAGDRVKLEIQGEKTEYKITKIS